MCNRLVFPILDRYNAMRGFFEQVVGMELSKAKNSSCWQCHDCLSCSGHSFFCVIGAGGFDCVAS